MQFSALHREDVLAQIRKAYGSAAAFERARDLPRKSVNEVLRGRANARTKRAIEELLSSAAQANRSEGSQASRNVGKAHRLSAGSK